MKRLKLKRQTVRALTVRDLSAIIGGAVPTDGVCLTRNNPCTWNECPSFHMCG